VNNKLSIKKVNINENQILYNKIINGNDTEKDDITIVDSIMGSGKTTWAIERMKNPNERFMYINPYLVEIERIKENLEGIKHFYAPSNENDHGSKKYDFFNYIKNGLDIAATHSLFRNCDKEILEYIKLHDYILVLDEVMGVVEIKKISKADYEMLLQTSSISISYDGKVNWLNDNYNGSFDWIKEYAISGQLYKHKSADSQKVAFFVWQFPAEVFKYFKKVYIMTYLFNGQIQKYYFDLHKLKYQFKQIEMIDGKYTLVDYVKENEYKRRRELSKLINLYNGKLNSIGDSWNSFSSSYYKRQQNNNQMQQIKKNTENYMQHIAKGKSEFNMWTTFEKHKFKLKGRGYSNGFISVNARATNQYAHKKNLAYLCNRFLFPYELNYFKDLGININQDLWALSELVQWIWRSSIRNNEPINIYIPSSRMRTLLVKWLDCEEDKCIDDVA
jgi:hypothetical protein